MAGFAILLGAAALAAGLLSVLSGSARNGGVRPQLHRGLVQRVLSFRRIVESEADGLQSVRPSLVLAVIARESGGDPNAAGRADEIGLMQLTEPAWRDYARATSDPEAPDFGSVETVNINIRVGAWFLQQKIEEMGSVFEGLRAYNCGTVGARNNPTCGAEYARWITEVAEPQFRAVA